MSMHGRTDRPRERTSAGPRAGAFTIIEMMVVIGILIVLVTLVVSVSKYVYDEASRKQTQASQAVILAAIEAYHAAAVPNDYPPESDSKGLSKCLTLVQYLTGKHDGNLDGALEVDLTSRAEVKAAVAELANLPTDCYDGSAASAFKDGYGNEMDYEVAGGLGGTPVLISAGPDADLGTTEDNIRSDRN